MEAFIQVTDVSHQFTQRNGEKYDALKHVNLTIHQGEVVVIVGTNGAGKSTLLNCFTGQLPFAQGSIRVGERHIERLSQVEIAASIGRVFQNPSMGTAPRMTVFENLMLATQRGQRRGLRTSLTPQNLHEMQVYVAPFKLNLENRMHVPIEYLSGGQRQIVSLIMATLCRPSLLLLDEHTAALDPRTAQQVMEMTDQLIRREKLTTLMITHHLQDALDYGDRVVVMHNGEIRQTYAGEELAALSVGQLYAYMESLFEDDLRTAPAK